MLCVVPWTSEAAVASFAHFALRHQGREWRRPCQWGPSCEIGEGSSFAAACRFVMVGCCLELLVLTMLVLLTF